MILADFSGLRHNQQRKVSEKNNMSLKSDNVSERLLQKDIVEKDIQTYIMQLDVPGVKDYYDSKQRQRKSQLTQTMNNMKQEHLRQSIQRLYSTGFNRKVTQNKKKPSQNCSSQQRDEVEDQTIQCQQTNTNPKPYYNELYQQDKRFDRQFRIRKLQIDCQQLSKKLWNSFTKKYRIWVATDENDKKQLEYKKMSLKPDDPRSKQIIIVQQLVQKMFIRSLVSFLLGYDIGVRKSGDFMTCEDEFFIAYSDFLNNRRRTQWQQSPHKNVQYDRKVSEHLKHLSKKLPWVEYILNWGDLVQSGSEKIRNVQDLQIWIVQNLNQQRNWERIYQSFQKQLEVKFTVPFQTKLYQVKKPPQSVKNDDQEQVQKFQSFRANPVPSSTYHHQRPQSAHTKKPPTQPVPFNFTQTHSSAPKLSPDQLYSWDRNFKAKPIPKTLYEPQPIGTNQNQRQLTKKQHNQNLFQQAKFPKTMNYLENYHQIQEEKKKQLELKYAKNRLEQKSRPKPVPDFEKIHKKNMVQLQAKKSMNRTCTQPKPFNFAQTKKSNFKNTYKNIFYGDDQFLKQKHKKKITQQNIPEAKSTAKFEAYVQLRKQQKEEKKKQIIQKQEFKKRKQEDMKKYKDILKQRMQNQLSHQPKAPQYGNNIQSNNMVKVDLEEIYLSRPLLMESVGGKNGMKNDDRRTCFTDSYEPII